MCGGVLDCCPLRATSLTLGTKVPERNGPWPAAQEALVTLQGSVWPGHAAKQPWGARVHSAGAEVWMHLYQRDKRSEVEGGDSETDLSSDGWLVAAPQSSSGRGEVAWTLTPWGPGKDCWEQ